MPANVETMFYVREVPWHGLGVKVDEALSSGDALKIAVLDWNVIQNPIYTDSNTLISGYKVNIRETDRYLGLLLTGIKSYKILKRLHSQISF